MGRHSLPDGHRLDGTGARPRGRRRNVAIATALVLAVASGVVAVVEGGLLSFRGSCADDSVRLRIVASPDVAPAVREAADHARTEGVTSDGRCLDVKVTARESHEVADALGAGNPETDFEIWLPDSDMWVRRAQLSENAVSTASVGHVASSPVAVAMVPSAAKSLGWPKKTYTWAELTAAALESDKLRLGAADPARSATCLLALSRIGASAQRQGPDGDALAAGAAKVLSQRISDGDSQVLATLPRDDSGAEEGNPRRNQALILSEQAAFKHNAAGGSAGLELFYPKDGAPLLDYPFTLVDESKLSLDENRAAMRFMTLLGDDQGRRILEQHGFRTRRTVAADRIVRTAGGRAPQPYTDAPVEPPSDKELQEALGMWTITVQSARLTTVVDASESMAAPVPGHGDRSRMDVTKDSLLQGLATFTPEDEVGLWEFSTLLDGDRDYRELVPTRRLGNRTKDGSTHRERLTTAFNSLTPRVDGATGLYDTILAACRSAQKSYANGKFNALVILTDGANQDPVSISRSALIAELKKLADPERPVPLIAIAIGPNADKQELGQIAKATGGAAYQVSDPAQIHTVILKAITAVGRG